MVILANKKSTRSSTPRVKTGCKTCRKRHIKCDEAKPSCLKCAQAGWTCDGYETHGSMTEASANSKAKPTLNSPEPVLAISSYAIPFRIPGSQSDRQIFHYFCVQGSYEVAGPIDSGFWTKTVLQECHQEPVVLKALISLGSLHLDYFTETSSESITRRDTALVSYGKALRALHKLVHKPHPGSLKATLVCCIIFFCFEATLGNSEAAMRHLESGLKLLSSYHSLHRDEEMEDLRPIVQMFQRLDLQATLFDDDRIPFLDMTARPKLDSASPPSVFSNIDDACQGLVILQHWLFMFLTKNIPYKFLAEEKIPGQVSEEKVQLSKQFRLWLKVFEKSPFQVYHNDQTTWATKTLLLKWRVSWMLLEADYPTNEAVFGACPNREAEDILALASDVLQHSLSPKAASEVPASTRRTFCSDTTVVAPLFLLAMKCADESICLRAATMLQLCRRREGLYDSNSMAAVVHHLRAVKANDMLESGLEFIIDSENIALERLREGALNRRFGGMDRIIEFV
ncbi:hypothetical protein IQ07DRAFT_384903 [Pyrenochaeta sp. DS3sAY3a]|nr:hypothetical protein IQ07DRAFT_384903 [Pyrenochaeta sp. DS3sAY3a]